MRRTGDHFPPIECMRISGGEMNKLAHFLFSLSLSFSSLLSHLFLDARKSESDSKGKHSSYRDWRGGGIQPHFFFLLSHFPFSPSLISLSLVLTYRWRNLLKPNLLPAGRRSRLQTLPLRLLTRPNFRNFQSRIIQSSPMFNARNRVYLWLSRCTCGILSLVGFGLLSLLPLQS